MAGALAALRLLAQALPAGCGAGGTAFWVDPKEDMLVVYMMQSPSKRTHYRAVLRDMIYASLVK